MWGVGIHIQHEFSSSKPSIIRGELPSLFKVGCLNVRGCGVMFERCNLKSWQCVLTILSMGLREVESRRPPPLSRPLKPSSNLARTNYFLYLKHGKIRPPFASLKPTEKCSTRPKIPLHQLFNRLALCAKRRKFALLKFLLSFFSLNGKFYSFLSPQMRTLCW